MRHFHLHLPRVQRKSLLTDLVLALAVIEPVMTAPQVYKIWVEHKTAGISLLTWSFYMFAATIWLLYGLKLKNAALIISSSLWFLFEAAVVVGVILY